MRIQTVGYGLNRASNINMDKLRTNGRGSQMKQSLLGQKGGLFNMKSEGGRKQFRQQSGMDIEFE